MKYYTEDHVWVEIRGDEATQKLADGSVAATEEDWGTEYADYILSTRVVKNLDEAIQHIRKYSTGHSLVTHPAPGTKATISS